MDETLMILLSIYGSFSTILFVCVILACRMEQEVSRREENNYLV